MYFEPLARNSLITRQNSFSLHIEANGRCLGICRLNDPTDDLTDLAFEILHLIRTFCFTNALLNDLTCGLCSNTPKVGWGRFNNHHIAKLRFWVNLARFLQQDFSLWLLYVFHHFLLGEDHDLASIRINFGFYVLCCRRVDSPPISRNHGGLNRSKDNLLRELFFFQHFVESQGELVLCHANCSVYSYITSRKVGVAHFSVRAVISSTCSIILA